MNPHRILFTCREKSPTPKVPSHLELILWPTFQGYVWDEVEENNAYDEGELDQACIRWGQFVTQLCHSMAQDDDAPALSMTRLISESPKQTLWATLRQLLGLRQSPPTHWHLSPHTMPEAADVSLRTERYHEQLIFLGHKLLLPDSWSKTIRQQVDLDPVTLLEQGDFAMTLGIEEAVLHLWSRDETKHLLSIVQQNAEAHQFKLEQSPHAFISHWTKAKRAALTH